MISFPDGVKLGVRRPAGIVPDFALLDPALALGMPDESDGWNRREIRRMPLTALWRAQADELNQAIALKAIKMIFEWLPNDRQRQ